MKFTCGKSHAFAIIITRNYTNKLCGGPLHFRETHSQTIDSNDVIVFILPCGTFLVGS